MFKKKKAKEEDFADASTFQSKVDTVEAEVAQTDDEGATIAGESSIESGASWDVPSSVDVEVDDAQQDLEKLMRKEHGMNYVIRKFDVSRVHRMLYPIADITIEDLALGTKIRDDAPDPNAWLIEDPTIIRFLLARWTFHEIICAKNPHIYRHEGWIKKMTAHRRKIRKWGRGNFTGEEELIENDTLPTGVLRMYGRARLFPGEKLYYIIVCTIMAFIHAIGFMTFATNYEGWFANIGRGFWFCCGLLCSFMLQRAGFLMFLMPSAAMLLMNEKQKRVVIEPRVTRHYRIMLIIFGGLWLVNVFFPLVWTVTLGAEESPFKDWIECKSVREFFEKRSSGAFEVFILGIVTLWGLLDIMSGFVLFEQWGYVQSWFMLDMMDNYSMRLRVCMLKLEKFHRALPDLSKRDRNRMGKSIDKWEGYMDRCSRAVERFASDSAQGTGYVNGYTWLGTIAMFMTAGATIVGLGADFDVISVFVAFWFALKFSRVMKALFKRFEDLEIIKIKYFNRPGSIKALRNTYFPEGTFGEFFYDHQAAKINMGFFKLSLLQLKGIVGLALTAAFTAALVKVIVLTEGKGEITADNLGGSGASGGSGGSGGGGGGGGGLLLLV